MKITHISMHRFFIIWHIVFSFLHMCHKENIVNLGFHRSFIHFEEHELVWTVKETPKRILCWNDSWQSKLHSSLWYVYICWNPHSFTHSNVSLFTWFQHFTCSIMFKITWLFSPVHTGVQIWGWKLGSLVLVALGWCYYPMNSWNSSWKHKQCAFLVYFQLIFFFRIRFIKALYFVLSLSLCPCNFIAWAVSSGINKYYWF